MSRNEPTELLVAVHYDPPEGRAIRISIDGENSKAKWIAKSLIGSFHFTGKTTRGTDRGGQNVILPLANLVVPEWLALKEGLI